MLIKLSNLNLKIPKEENREKLKEILNFNITMEVFLIDSLNDLSHTYKSIKSNFLVTHKMHLNVCRTKSA